MSKSVLAKVYQHAMIGNMKAARLYFNVIGMLDNDKSQNTQIANQNNYIQINGMVLSQEAVTLLNPEQLNTIAAILKSANLQWFQIKAKRFWKNWYFWDN